MNKKNLLALEMETTIDVRDKIKNHLAEHGIKLTWLSEKTKINYNTLYSILVQKTTLLSNGRKKLITAALKKRF